MHEYDKNDRFWSREKRGIIQSHVIPSLKTMNEFILTCFILSLLKLEEVMKSLNHNKNLVKLVQAIDEG